MNHLSQPLPNGKKKAKAFSHFDLVLAALTLESSLFSRLPQSAMRFLQLVGILSLAASAVTFGATTACCGVENEKRALAHEAEATTDHDLGKDFRPRFLRHHHDDDDDDDDDD